MKDIEEIAREEFDKRMRECCKKISKLVGRSFGGDVGYEDLPEVVEQRIKQPVIIDQNGVAIEYNFFGDAIQIDTRTEQEKLIDDIAEAISAKGALHNELYTAKEIAKMLIDSDILNISRKEQ